jgi:hypothetical protein
MRGGTVLEKGKSWGRYDDSILVRMDKALKERVERLSIEEDIPVSTMARRLIRKALEAEEGKKKKKQPA